MNTDMLENALPTLVMVIALGAFLSSQLSSRIKAVDSMLTKAETTLTTQINHVESSVNQRIDDVENRLSAEISRVESSVNQRIDDVGDRLSAEISRVESSVNQRIDDAENRLSAEISRVETGLRAEIIEARLDTKALEARVFYLATNQKQPPLNTPDLHAAQFPTRAKQAPEPALS